MIISSPACRFCCSDDAAMPDQSAILLLFSFHSLRLGLLGRMNRMHFVIFYLLRLSFGEINQAFCIQLKKCFAGVFHGMNLAARPCHRRGRHPHHAAPPSQGGAAPPPRGPAIWPSNMYKFDNLVVRFRERGRGREENTVMKLKFIVNFMMKLKFIVNFAINFTFDAKFMTNIIFVVNFRDKFLFCRIFLWRILFSS